MVLPTSPDESIVVQRLKEHKRLLNSHDASTMVTMAEEWIGLEKTMEANISLLARELAEAQAAEEAVGIGKIMRMDRFQQLNFQLRGELGNYNDWAADLISENQERLGALGIDHAAEAIQLSMFEGGGGMGAFFNRLPVSAIENMVGLAGKGGPVRTLLDEAFPVAADRMAKALVEGTALGLNPREVAKNMTNGMAEGLNRATNIARTEQLRVYREGSRQQYEASGLVDTFRRLAAKNDATCAMCLALDGEVYEVADLMHVHSSDRCTMVPVVKGMPKVEWETGEEWLAKQDPETQQKILGKGKFDLYEEGELNLSDIVVKTEHPVWGPSLTEVPLKDVGRVAVLGEEPLHVVSLAEGITEDASVTLRDFEGGISADPIETATVMTVDGKDLFTKVGTENSVEFTASEVLQIEKSHKPIILSHNHPSGSSFSREDFVMGFTTKNLDTIRATTRYRTFEMKFIGKGIEDDLGEIFEKLDKLDGRTRKYLQSHVGKATITTGEAEWLHSHRVWQEFAFHNPDIIEYKVFGDLMPSSGDIRSGKIGREFNY